MSSNEDMRDTANQQKERRAIAFSALFLILGLFVVWFTTMVLKVEGDAILVSLLLAPVLVYLILSGKIKELRAPGGLAITFAETATASVTAVWETVQPSEEDMQIVVKEGVQALERKRQTLNEAQPIVMTMVLGRGRYYNTEDTLRYIDVLSQFRNFRFVVFVDDSDRFVAYMPISSLKGILRVPELGEHLIYAVNEGQVQDLFRFPGVVRETISTQSTNAEALREMTRQNLEALVVIDENRHLRGVVERKQVLSRMMLALTEQAVQ